jgi:nicotinamidase/pyrazinamidase
MLSRKFVLWEVDAQADFMLPGGKLYVPGAEKIIPNINRLVDVARAKRALLISSSCSHTTDDPEFQTFPPHCLRGTLGARIVPEGLTEDFSTIPTDATFKLPADLLKHQQIVIEKQMLDVFSNPHTSTIVEKLARDAEFIVFGVVTEYCVNLAAKGLLDRGRKVAIVKDAIETLKADEGQRTVSNLTTLGARLITTNEALAAIV